MLIGSVALGSGWRMWAMNAPPRRAVTSDQREDRGGEAGLALVQQADEQDRAGEQPDPAHVRRR